MEYNDVFVSTKNPKSNNDCLCKLKTGESFLHTSEKRIINIGDIEAQIGFSIDNNDFYVLTNENQKIEAEKSGGSWGKELLGHIPTIQIKIINH